MRIMSQKLMCQSQKLICKIQQLQSLCRSHESRSYCSIKFSSDQADEMIYKAVTSFAVQLSREVVV